MSQSLCAPEIFGGTLPPIRPGVVLPVLRSRCGHRTTPAGLTLEISTTARTLLPAARQAMAGPANPPREVASSVPASNPAQSSGQKPWHLEIPGQSRSASSCSSCSIPCFDAAIFPRKWREAPWARFSMAATTTAAVRRAIQHGQESLRASPSATASTTRSSPGGSGVARPQTCQQGPKTGSRLCCRSKTRPSSSPSVVTRCYHSTTACMPWRRPSHT